MSANETDVFALLPPIDDYNLIGIMVATLIYGANSLLYVSCMYILVERSMSGRDQRLLLVASTILMILATIHIGASLAQLRQAFIQAPRTLVPGASILYWTTFTNTAAKLHSYTYVLLDTTQDSILIWRLYLVWSQNWKVIVIPIVLELCHTAVALYDTAISSRPGASLNAQNAIHIIALAFLASVNFSTTGGIAGRLWYLGRKSAIVNSYFSTDSKSNRYLVPILTIVESGAIFTSSMICLLVFIIINSPLLTMMISISAQLAAFTPFLIVARVGFGLTHKPISQRKENASTNVRLRGTNASRSAGAAVVSLDQTESSLHSLPRTCDYPLQDVGTDIESGKSVDLHGRGEGVFVVDIDRPSRRSGDDTTFYK